MLVMMTACSEVGPDVPPPPPYEAGEKTLTVGWESGEVVVRPFGNENKGFFPIVFLKEGGCLSGDDFHQFENRQYDLGEIYGGLDVVTYCRGIGLESCPDSHDFFVPYRWIEVACGSVAPDNQTEVVVRVAENTSPETRIMSLHFFNGQWGLLTVIQEGAQD